MSGARFSCRRIRVFQTLGTALGLALFASCLRLSIPPPEPAPGSIARTGGSRISLTFSGVPDLQRPDFARAFPSARTPLARLLGSRVSNRTGSVARLLEPPLRSLLAGRAAHRSDARVSGELRVTELRLEWRPPQEFIKTPRARYAGRVEARLAGSWSVTTIGRGAPQVETRSFRVSLSQRVFPGQEETAMSELMAVALRDLLTELGRTTK